MQDNLSIVITTILLVTLIIIFPLYNFFERQDDMSYNLVLKATTNFVDEVKNNGYIDQSNYDNFVKQLANTGIIYNIDIECHRKILLEDMNKDEYEEKYEIDYNKDIFDEIDNTLANAGSIKQKIYKLNEDDQIYVKVKNKNKTTAEMVFSMIAPNKNNKNKIVVNYGGVVKNAAWKKVDTVVYDREREFTKPIIELVKPNNIYFNGIELVLTSDINEIRFKASMDPRSGNWWNSITDYIWSVNNENGAVYIPEQTLSKDINFSINNLSEGTYILNVKGYNSSNSRYTESATVKIRTHQHNHTCVKVNFDREHQSFNGGFTQSNWAQYTTVYGSPQRLYAVRNIINLTSPVTSNRYVNINLSAGCLTREQTYNLFNLLINGEWLTINEAINRGYIEKETDILTTSSNPYLPHPYYQNILYGGHTGLGNWQYIDYKFKLLNAVISAVKVDVGYSTRPGDGIWVRSGNIEYICGH